MANYIPEGKISEIKHTADIVDVVSDVVVLKKSGRNFIGLCPFHSEKTPSFTVSPEKHIFHCFGCGEGGSVFAFLMKHEGLSFPEAVRILAKRYGIEIPEQSMSPEQRREISEKEKLYEVHRQAVIFYKNQLYQKGTQKKGRSYLKERRISQEILDDFAIGYAPKGWDHLSRFFMNKKIALSLVAKSGLIIPRKNANGFYDRFRERVVFPIFNPSGDAIAFGGRATDDTLPKYLNSPDTPIFNKRRSLYGLHKAKKQCRETETVIIVEGYFDLLALYQHGIQNTVATLGTSLTPEHVQVLRGFVGKAGKAVLVFDSDVAGIKAARRSIEVFGKGYVDAQILILPEGHDPDSYIFKYGAEAFKKAARNALSILPYLVESAIEKHGLSIEGKIHIISDLSAPLASISDKMERSLYLKFLSERIGVEESALLEKVRQAMDRQKRVARDRSRSANMQSSESPNDTLLQKRGQKNIQKPGSRLEKQIVAMMLQFPAILPEIRDRDLMRCFENEILRSIGTFILSIKDFAPERLSEIMDGIGSEEKRGLATSLAIGEDIWEYEGCLKLITQFEASRSRQSKELLQEIKAAEESNNQELLVKLLQHKQAQAKNKGQR